MLIWMQSLELELLKVITKHVFFIFLSSSVDNFNSALTGMEYLYSIKALIFKIKCKCESKLLRYINMILMEFMR